MPASPEWYLPVEVSSPNLVYFPITCMRVTCPTNLTSFYLLTITILDEKHSTVSFSLCNFFKAIALHLYHLLDYFVLKHLQSMFFLQSKRSSFMSSQDKFYTIYKLKILVESFGIYAGRGKEPELSSSKHS
jgi:hypothetical protein